MIEGEDDGIKRHASRTDVHYAMLIGSQRYGWRFDH